MQRLRDFTNWCLTQKDPAIAHTPFHRNGIVIRTSLETQRTRRLYDGEEAALLTACDQVNDLDHYWAGGALKRRILGTLYAGARGSELDRVRVEHIDWRAWT